MRGIVALTRQTLSPQRIVMGNWQAVSAADPEIEAFVQDVTSRADALSQTDIGLARVLEDLIDALINRGLLQFTDLPEAAQAKLLERRQTRASLGHTGRPRHAGPLTVLIYMLVNLGAVLRVFGPMAGLPTNLVLGLAAGSWSGAYVLFAMIYGPFLLRPSLDE